ncbi:hypothetical protein PHYPO_G00198730 [Pangasianodon hypophthalmus]|uniref:Uncharacterized protein n=1 Tax=Pangasianodon hypophthalmus TaxID=310915 RepID=A0A5N5PKR0_PANHP|nr:hypothetical protein PHYPO_G00198730 [Pangasianodon hypophthalmus]
MSDYTSLGCEPITARYSRPLNLPATSGKRKCSLQPVLFLNFKSVSPEATSGCLRSTRRSCPSGTQTSALRGRTISRCLFTGTLLPFYPFSNCS